MDWLLDSDTPIERKTLLPSPNFFKSNDRLEKEQEKAALQTLQEASNVVLADSDADGYGVFLAIRQKYPDSDYIPCGPHGQLDVEDVLSLIVDNTNELALNNIFVGDIAVDNTQGFEKADIETVIDSISGMMYWWDHHQWEDETISFFEKSGVNLTVRPPKEDEKYGFCGAELTLQWVQQSETVSEVVEEAIEITGVYDLWKKQTDEDGNKTSDFIDSRAQNLSDFASICEDAVSYVEKLEQFGADIFESPEVKEEVLEYRVEQKVKRALAVNRADYYTIEGVSVAITYGDCPQNDVADVLREQGADLVIILKPGGGISFRGSKDFTECHKLANRFDGGGHEQAAGGFLAPKKEGNYDDWDTDLLDYANYWLTEGRNERDYVLSELEEMLAENM